MTPALMRMLAVDPQERPSMTEVRDDLAAIVAGRGGDTTTVLTARTDVASTRPQPTNLPPPPAASTPPPAPPRTLVEAVRPERAAPAPQPVDEPATPPPDRSRRRLVPWIAAAVLLLLVGLGALLASVLNDPAGDAANETPTASSPAATSSEGGEATTSDAPSTSDAAEETTASSTAAESSAEGDTTLDADNVEDLLDEYHELVFDDPAAAYEQAGPTLRSAIDLQGFEDYWGRFSDVEISDVQVEDGGDTALATMAFVWQDGSTQVERHRFTFIDQDGRLVLDSDRFVETIQGRS